MKKAESIVKKITGAVSIISYVGFFGVMAVTIADIILRWITGIPILGVYEIVERIMICAVFASFAYTQTENGHVQITMVVSKFPQKLRFLVMTLNNILSAAVIVLTAYAAYRQCLVAMSSKYTTGVLLIPLWPFYWVEIISMAVLCLAFLFHAVKNAVAIFNKDIAAEIQAEWS